MKPKQHCEDCYHCKVTGSPDDPWCSCKKGRWAGKSYLIIEDIDWPCNTFKPVGEGDAQGDEAWTNSRLRLFAVGDADRLLEYEKATT